MAGQARPVRRKKPVPQPAWQRALRVSLWGSLALTLLVGVLLLRDWLLDPQHLPLRVVKITGEMAQLDRARLEQRLSKLAAGSFFGVDLAAVQDAAESLPWVARASVQRRWPDTLTIDVAERQAVARWGEKALVTAEGVVFEPSNGLPRKLVRLDGPVERAAEVVQQLQRQRPAFARLGLEIERLSLTERGAWQIVFANGTEVAIGNEQLAQRLDRLRRLLPLLHEQRGDWPRRVDLRYRHGLTVQWSEQQQAAQQNDQKGNA